MLLLTRRGSFSGREEDPSLMTRSMVGLVQIWKIAIVQQTEGLSFLKYPSLQGLCFLFYNVDSQFYCL
jgi:hypothetical protein